MKQNLAVVFILFAFLPLAFAQELNLPRPSQKASVMQTIGLTDVTITYSRPGVKGRVIWGGLVPYDRVWRTGANEATSITFSDEVTIDGKTIPAGVYGLHTIPGKAEWTVIFNKAANQWGSYDYDESKDILRIQVKPQEGPHQEWMMFSFAEVLPGSAIVELAWEKLRVRFRIETNTMKKATENIKAALERTEDWRIPYRAADFAWNTNSENSAETYRWIDRSIALKETYWNLRLKASMLARDGKKKDAITIAEKAVSLGKENKDEPTEIEKTEKQISEWKGTN